MNVSKISHSLLLTSFALLLVFSKSANAINCTGNACNDVVFSFTNGCYVTENHGSKRIKVQMGVFSFTLQRGESHTLILSGKCVGGFVGGTTANYK